MKIHLVLIVLFQFKVCIGNLLDRAHVFTVHQHLATWNEARHTCSSEGGSLLSINNETEWTLWKTLLDGNKVAIARSSPIYWFGLHLPVREQTQDTFYWDTCSAADYLEPAADDIVATTGQCVYLWIQREIFVDVTISMWLKGRDCDRRYPFICMKEIDDSSCVPAECDEYLTPTPTSGECDALCTDANCINMYFATEPGICHYRSAVHKDNSQFTICYRPSVQYQQNICDTDTVVSSYDFIDNNVNVTDTSCLDPTTTSTTPAVTSPVSLTTTPVDTTTTLTTSKADGTCTCECKKLRTFMATPAPKVVNLTMEEKIDIIVAELTVNKKNVSSAIRRTVSIMDYRASSVGLGAVAVGIIIGIFGIIILMDLSRIWHELCIALHKIQLVLKGLKFRHRDIKVGVYNIDKVMKDFAKDETKTKGNNRTLSASNLKNNVSIISNKELSS